MVVPNQMIISPPITLKTKAWARIPAKCTGVSRRYGRFKRLPLPSQIVLHVMVHGIPDDRVNRFGHFKAHEPMTLIDACRILGFDCGRILQIARLPLFAKQMTVEIETRRMMEFAKNLGVAIQIRDDIGDGSPRANEVRLKAITTIEGTFRNGTGTNVQINNFQPGDRENLRPGYVIRTQPRAKMGKPKAGDEAT